MGYSSRSRPNTYAFICPPSTSTKEKMDVTEQTTLYRQPIKQLPLIAFRIGGMVEYTTEQHEMLQLARP